MEKNLPNAKLLHIKDAPFLPYPHHYVTQLPPGKDPDDSEYEVPITPQDQKDHHSLYEEIDNSGEIYEDVEETETL